MFPMGIVTQRTTQGRWRSKLFTSSTTWDVPADVGCIWVDGCGGGAGGGGGYNGSAGGGGSGGGAGICVIAQIAPVTPSATLTITVGAGGVGGAVGAEGAHGGISSIFLGTTNVVSLTGGPEGIAGTATKGAGALGFGCAVVNSSTTGGGGAARQLAWFNANSASQIGPYFPGTGQLITSGGGGGGPGHNGGGAFAGSVVCGRDVGGLAGSTLYLPGGAGNGTGGGGGAGGLGVWAVGCCFSGPNVSAGEGGAGGQAGFNAHPASFGCGGGGGGGNAAGGNGTPGMIRIYCFTAYAI